MKDFRHKPKPLWNSPKKRNEYKHKSFFKLLHDVRKRDKHCKFPGCTNRYRLQVHHIKLYANYPTLRQNPHNLITLCCKHHKLVKGKEEEYETLFSSIINPNIDKIRQMMNEEEEKERVEKENKLNE